MRPSNPSCIELLEPRKLFSAWTTVSSDPSQDEVCAMAADKNGGVYALDDWNGTVRKSSDGGATWATMTKAPTGTTYDAMAVDPAGDLFLAGQGIGSDGKGGHWLVLEQLAGQSGFSVIDDVSGGSCVGLATDSAGDVFAIGSKTVIVATTSHGKTTTTSTEYATVRERLAGHSTFSTIEQTTGTSFSAITAIDSGASAGVYVVGKSNTSWAVLKGANAGQSWSLVDQYQYPTTTAPDNMAMAVVGDLSGNVFVAGEGTKAVVTGYTRNKTPIYSSQSHWLVRKSGDGGVSWSVDDDYQLASSASAYAQGMGTDLAGNVYVGGGANDANNLSHAIIRTNSGGTWATVDDYVTTVYGAQYLSFTVDSNGKLYAGGQDDNWWVIRSTSGPAAATSGSFSATAISSSKSVRDPLLNLIS